MVLRCPGFGWDKVIFFLVAGIMLCFGVGTKIMLITYWCFQLLLGRQGLFSSSCWPGLRLRGKLGGDTAGTADPNWPKGCYMPYNVILSVWAGGVGWGQKLLLGNRACSVHWVVSNCICASLVLHIYYYYIFPCFPIKLSLSQPMSFYFYSLSASLRGRGVSEWLHGAYLLAGVKQLHTSSDANCKGI